MKHYLFGALLVLFMAKDTSAQWTQQPTPVKSNLTDIAFFGSRLGYAVGSGGTVLKTLNGGKTWKQVTAPDSADITSVTILDTFAVMVTTAGTYGSGSVYESRNQGNTWYKTLSDTRTFYATATPGRKLYSTSSHIYTSENLGRNWQEQDPLNSTTTYTNVTFTDDQNGLIAGNISGIVSYSADLSRTTDGFNWYRLNSFSFPNANGYSALSPLNADSIILVTNFYNRFSPGDSSQLILLTNFKLRRDFTDSLWYFSTKTINPSFHDRISDCKFFASGTGYVTSETGSVYTTANFGRKLEAEYQGKSPLHALYMLDENTGYAVGDGGLILKREAAATPVVGSTPMAVKVYPNPASSNATLSFHADGTIRARVQVTNERGLIVWTQAEKTFSGGMQQVSIPVSSLERGVYHINLIANGRVAGSAQLLVVH